MAEAGIVQRRQGVNHLVALAGGDEAVEYCCSNSYLGLGRRDEPFLLGRDHHVVLAEGDARLRRRVAEAEAHQAVGEDHQFLLAAMTVNGVDHVEMDC